MTVDQVLLTLRERGAELYLDGDRLRYRGPRRPPDDPIRAAIQQHRETLVTLVTARDATPASSVSVEAVAGSPPVLSAADLFSIAAMRGWEALPLRPGERAGGSQKHWQIFTEWASGPVLTHASRAAWIYWRSTVEHYQELMADPQVAALFPERGAAE